jgi:hypothetical protein
MKRKKLLIATVVLFSILGMVFVATPFVSSLQPSKKAEAALARVDISNIEPGSFKIMDHPAYGELYNGFEWSLIIFRATDGQFYFWDVPTKDGAVGMPDLFWVRPFYPCQMFGPTIENGFVDESMPIICHDSELPSKWWAMRWRWDVRGKALDSMMEDLQVTRGIVDGKYFVIGKSS